MSFRIAFSPEEHEASGPNMDLESLPFPPSSTAPTRSDSFSRISKIMDSNDNSTFLIDTTGFNRHMCGLYTGACHSIPSIPIDADGRVPCSYSETLEDNADRLDFLRKELPQYAFLTAAIDPRDTESVERVKTAMLMCRMEEIEKTWGSVTIDPQKITEGTTKPVMFFEEKNAPRCRRRQARPSSKKRTRRKSKKRIVQTTNPRVMDTKRKMRKRIVSTSNRRQSTRTKYPVTKYGGV